MPLRPESIAIEASDPFANDQLQRRASAEFLTGLLADSPDGFVLGLNAPWGHGKTTFLTMWRHELERKGVRCISLNAWESDFVNDPLVALSGELEASLSNLALPPGTSESVSKRISRLKVIGAAIVRSAIPAVVRIGTAGVLDLDSLMEESVSAAAEEVAAKQIEEYLSTKNSICEYRKSLAELAKQFRAGGNDDQAYPIVFLIDELDRCRPNFAIQMLECIKHLFSVEGVAFVVAVDMRQLEHSVRHMYGAGMDASGYLRRFFDLELALPASSLESFLRLQFKRFNISAAIARVSDGNDPDARVDWIFQVISALLNAYGASLRDAERVFALLYLGVTSTPTRHHIYPHLLAAIAVLKVVDQENFSALKTRNFSLDKWIEWLQGRSAGRTLLASDIGKILEGQLFAATVADLRAATKRYRWIVQNGASDETKVRASQILEYFNYPEMQASADALGPILKRLDIAAAHGAG